jgi:predicted AAA+ superfamily ATPase
MELQQLQNKAELEAEQERGRKEDIEFKQKYLADKNPISYDFLKDFRTIAIYGNTGSGKTALAYKIIEQFKGKKNIYFMKYPRPSLIKSYGYANLLSLEELEKKRNCVIFLDEPQLYLNVYTKKSNFIIAKICSLCRQLGITLILSSSDTRVFGRHNESYFDLWIIKDIDYSMVKNGSKIKNAIKDNSILEPSGLRLEVQEFILENRKVPEMNGRHTFKLPLIWNDALSKPYC